MFKTLRTGVSLAAPILILSLIAAMLAQLSKVAAADSGLVGLFFYSICAIVLFIFGLVAWAYLGICSAIFPGMLSRADQVQMNLGNGWPPNVIFMHVAIWIIIPALVWAPKWLPYAGRLFEKTVEKAAYAYAIVTHKREDLDPSDKAQPSQKTLSEATERRELATELEEELEELERLKARIKAREKEPH